MSAVKIMPPDKAVGGRWYASQAAEEKKTVETGKGVLHRLAVFNSNASGRFLWVFDNTASSGTLLIAPIPLAANVGFADLTFLTGIPFTTGLRVASSTSGTTFTASTTADLSITAGWVLTP